MKKITSFEAACAKKGIGTELPDVSTWPKAMQAAMIALYKLTVIHDAIVGNCAPDWNNSRQHKWYPWFYLNSPGFRFYSAFFSCSVSCVGSRLCFETEEQARYAGETFVRLYEAWLTMTAPAEEQTEVALLTPSEISKLKQLLKTIAD